jgi:hypothetical protein
VQNNEPIVGANQGPQFNPEGNAIGNAPNQNVPNQKFGNNAFDDLINEMEEAGDFQGNGQDEANEGNNAITLIVTISKGYQSHNGPNIINEEVNQE